MEILRNIGYLATCRPEGGQSEIHGIAEAALVWNEGRITWVGREANLPEAFASAGGWDAGGRLVVPGLIDCHTHLAFGGWRADEFERRLRGETYAAIARGGGGINATVQATRAMDEASLISRCLGFLEAMRRLGVTTVEAKSGYGLSAEHELKLLRVYRHLAQRQPSRLVPTFLGAHVVPPEWRDDREAYVSAVLNVMIPAIAREDLAVFCDVFVEDTAFTIDEARRILLAARTAGLAPKLHADQLRAGGGAELAAEVGAVSADHLEHVTEAGLAALARAGTVAVALPLAALYLRQSPMPARRMIEAGIPVALATDFNPGSAPSYDLHVAMWLGCTLLGLTPHEALKAVTYMAARAVGREADLGSLEEGKAADFVVIDAPDPVHWLYHFRPDTCLLTVIGGAVLYRAPGTRLADVPRPAGQIR